MLNRDWKRDLLAAFLLMLAWVSLIALATHQTCNDHCPTDEHCAKLCDKRGFCPSAGHP